MRDLWWGTLHPGGQTNKLDKSEKLRMRQPKLALACTGTCVQMPLHQKMNDCTDDMAGGGCHFLPHRQQK